MRVRHRTLRNANVIDQSGFSNMHGAGEQHIAMEIGRRTERHRIDDDEVVDLDSGRFSGHSMHQPFDLIDPMEPVPQCLFAGAQRAMQRRGERALLGRQIAVA